MIAARGISKLCAMLMTVVALMFGVSSAYADDYPQEGEQCQVTITYALDEHDVITYTFQPEMTLGDAFEQAGYNLREPSDGMHWVYYEVEEDGTTSSNFSTPYDYLTLKREYEFVMRQEPNPELPINPTDVPIQLYTALSETIDDPNADEYPTSEVWTRGDVTTPFNGVVSSDVTLLENGQLIISSSALRKMLQTPYRFITLAVNYTNGQYGGHNEFFELSLNDIDSDIVLPLAKEEGEFVVNDVLMTVTANTGNTNSEHQIVVVNYSNGGDRDARFFYSINTDITEGHVRPDAFVEGNGLGETAAWHCDIPAPQPIDGYIFKGYEVNTTQTYDYINGQSVKLALDDWLATYASDQWVSLALNVDGTYCVSFDSDKGVSDSNIGLLSSPRDSGLGAVVRAVWEKEYVPTPKPDPDPEPTPTPTPDPVEDVTVPETDGGTVEVEPVEAGETAEIVTEPEAGQEVRDVIVTDAEGNIVETEIDEDGTITFVMPEGGVIVEVVFGCDGGDLCGTHNFTDINHDNWYHDSIDWAVEEGIFHGYDNGTFGPDDTLTREMAATVLYNYFGGESDTGSTGLTDVAGDMWYFDAVNWAVVNGVMTGYEGTGTFGVGDGLTREQFCSVVAKAMKIDLSDVDTTVLNEFIDADSVSEWARPAVAWAVQQGILNGVEMDDGTRALSGIRDITRAEMAAMMKNAVDADVLVK